uniref:GDSL esterase/lipase n=1 Tax=Kalanchoe fedtschenkoi TaxID=63787 RepID=A0A7N0R7Z1_KALFE
MQAMSTFSRILLHLAALNLLISCAHSLLKLPENVTIPAVFMFGDSIVDTGNNNGLNTIVKANFRPYGRDFKGGQPTGRFSNGKVPSDILVSELGIKEYLPPYLDPALPARELLTGVCFASGGAGFDPLTSEVVSVKSLADQLGMLEEYKARILKIAGQDRADFIVANSLYIIAAGTNDILNTYYHFSFRSWQYNFAAYTDLMASHASDWLKKLYGLGARRIAVFSIPSIGCTPSQRTLYGGIERVCANNCNKPAQMFNSKIQRIIELLNGKLPGVRISYMDGYNSLQHIIQNKESYGFKYADVGCCGTGLYELPSYRDNIQNCQQDASPRTYHQPV